MKPNSVLFVCMGSIHRLTAALAKRLGGVQVSKQPASPEQRAKDLIKAIDAGGLPLNPAIVNHIARQLGLEVSTHAPMVQTVERIRKILESLEPRSKS